MGSAARAAVASPFSQKWRIGADQVDLDDEPLPANRAFVMTAPRATSRAFLRPRHHPRRPCAVVEGVPIAALAVGAERAFIGVEERFTIEARTPRHGHRPAPAQPASSTTRWCRSFLGPDHYLSGRVSACCR